MDEADLTGLLAAIDRADREGLEMLRLGLFGRHGSLTEAVKALRDVPPDLRPERGRVLNRMKAALEEALERRLEALEASALEARLLTEGLDVTLPGTVLPLGHIHPLALMSRRLEEVFVAMGFEVKRGPDIEDDWHNFEALNFPPDHPSRDMQDSFLLEGGWLLRTHTSPVQIRTMEERAPSPVRIVVPGRVFRRDDDITHAPVFHQVEGLVIDKDVSMAHLKSTLYTFAREIFGQAVPLRLRPSYFPFTEPSAELDIGCLFCHQEGCRVCKGTGWLEVLGSGMVHPNVLQNGGYDPTVVSGFAFGLGIERITMLFYNIPDVRLFYQGDLRFLEQF